MTAKIIDLHRNRRKTETETPDMSNLTGLARIMPVIVQFTDLDPSAILPTSSRTDLDIDSLEWVEINIELEDLLGVDLDADEFEELRTVGELADLVDRKMEAKANG